MKTLLALGLLFLAACASPRLQIERLATARVAPDFATYSLHRVGLVPLLGHTLDAEHTEALQGVFFSEFSRQTHFEIVPLDWRDLEEVQQSDPYVRGHYRPETVIDLARRFRLDGVLVGTITNCQFYTPQQLSLQFELVATETGSAIWSASVHLDSSSERVVEAVHAYYQASEPTKTADGDGWELALLSPRLFAQFAAWQIASLL